MVAVFGYLNWVQNQDWVPNWVPSPGWTGFYWKCAGSIMRFPPGVHFINGYFSFAFVLNSTIIAVFGRHVVSISRPMCLASTLSSTMVKELR